MAVSSKLSWIKSIKEFTVNCLQQLLALVLPFELGDASFLGNFSQLAPGFVTLRLETEGVALAVAQRGVVVRLHGVVWQSWIRSRRRGRIPLDEPEKIKGSSETKRNLEKIVKEVDDHCLRRAPVRLPSASSLARRLLLPAIKFFGSVSAGERKFGLAKA
jgi:hypothetical protein